MEFAESPRSSRELTAIRDEVLPALPSREQGVRPAQVWIDPATATVQVLVAESAVGVVRRAFAHHGAAVVVVGNGPPDLSARLVPHRGSRDGWPAPTLPTEHAAGRATDEIADLYRGEGFGVEVHHLGDPGAMTADLRPDRIRLLVHDGHVVDASQG